MAFERGLSPLRGLPMPAGSDELAESTEEPWTDGSCLELLARQPVSAPLSRPAPHIHSGLKLSHTETGLCSDWFSAHWLVDLGIACLKYATCACDWSMLSDCVLRGTLPCRSGAQAGGKPKERRRSDSWMTS